MTFHLVDQRQKRREREPGTHEIVCRIVLNANAEIEKVEKLTRVKGRPTVEMTLYRQPKDNRFGRHLALAQYARTGEHRKDVNGREA